MQVTYPAIQLAEELLTILSYAFEMVLGEESARLE